MIPRSSSTSPSARVVDGHPGRDRLDRARHRLERQRRLGLRACRGRCRLGRLGSGRRVGGLAHVRHGGLVGGAEPDQVEQLERTPGRQVLAALVDRLERARRWWPSPPAAALWSGRVRPRRAARPRSTATERVLIALAASVLYSCDVTTRPPSVLGTGSRPAGSQVLPMQPLAVVGEPAGRVLDIELRQLDRLGLAEDGG